MEQKQTNTIDNRYSFYRLLQEYKVVIPIIQRDFAQGRSNDKTEEIRTDFLDTLYNYLNDGETHDLDFVYGTIEESSPKKSFIPLDGQQRLTTLFLLHWYLMEQVLHNDKGNSEALKFKNVLKDKDSSVSKSLFSYRTRQSSTDFCDKLVDVQLDFPNLVEIDVKQEDKKGEKKVPSVAATIRNYNWFASKWDFDPTVQSMLTMLDAIHKKFGEANHQQFFSRLLDNSTPAIAFVYMDLDEYKLSDDLYIQMNSRGKPLTPFENFKAKFEQYIGDIMVTEKAKKKEEYKDLDISMLDAIKQQVENEYKNGNSTIDSVKKYFSFNIDTKWTYLFWAYCVDELNTVEPDKLEKALTGILDKKMANFFRVILTFQYAVEGNDPKTVIGRVLQNEKNAYISFSQYERNKILSPGSIEYLISSLDVLSNGSNKITTINPSSKYFDEAKVFESIINHGLTDANYSDLIRFHAYLRYLIYFGKKSPELLDEWMRFVYNISDLTNTRTDDPSRFAAAIKSITKMLDDMHCTNKRSVLTYLASKDNGFIMGYFSRWQVKEELIKAHLMRSSGSINWTDKILELERHDYFNGQIGFILEFSGIVDYFEQYNSFKGWNNGEEKKYYDDFVRNGKIASELFKGGYEKRDLATDALLERATMTFDWKYFLGGHDDKSPCPVVGHAYLLCTNESNMQRDFSWRKMLHINTDDAFRHQPIKELFKCIDENSVEMSVKGIIDYAIKSAKPINRLSWVDAFVRYPANMKKCRYGIIHFSDNRCILFHGMKYSKNDAELFTYTIWEKGIKSMSFDNKFDLLYKYANFAQECYPHIICKFTFDTQEYAIKITTVAENWDFKGYEYLFENVNDQFVPIPSDLQTNFLQHFGFAKSSNAEQWTRKSKASSYDDDKEVQSELTNMMTQLLTFI